MITLNHIKLMQRLVVTSAAVAFFTGCHSTRHEGATYYSDSVQTSYSGQSSRSSSSGASGASYGNSSQSSSESASIPLFKEELKVGTRMVDAGSVRLRKTVKTETVNQPVQLRQEQITVERQAGSGEGSQSQNQSLGQSGQNNLDQPFQEGQIEIRLQREEPVVEKQIVPTGRIVAQKTSRSEERNIQEQVRRDDIAVDKSGDSQNINISGNVMTESRESSGGSAESSAQSSGAARSDNTITDISMLSGSRATSLNGQRVELSSVRVERSSGRLIALHSQDSQERPIYVCVREPQQDLKAGQNVKVTGTIKAASQISQSGLSQQEQRMLQGQPFYIEAQTVEAQNQ